MLFAYHYHLAVAVLVYSFVRAWAVCCGSSEPWINIFSNVIYNLHLSRKRQIVLQWYNYDEGRHCTFLSLGSGNLYWSVLDCLMDNIVEKHNVNLSKTENTKHCV